LWCEAVGLDKMGSTIAISLPSTPEMP
jgi:hypothetical protein